MLVESNLIKKYAVLGYQTPKKHTIMDFSTQKNIKLG